MVLKDNDNERLKPLDIKLIPIQYDNFEFLKYDNFEFLKYDTFEFLKYDNFEFLKYAV